MEEAEKKLYPLLFAELQDNYVWGSETFKLADLGYRDTIVRNGWLAANTISEIMDTYIDRVTGEDVYAWYGRQFPISIKTIQVHGRMPLRVHPDDEISEQRYDALGKEKFWYILSAGKNATVSTGFLHDTDAGTFYEACLDGSADKLLNTVAAHAGQCFHISPGTVHCAGGELTIVEISESSALDFCLCAWGQQLSTDEFDPSLGLSDALDFINFAAFRPDGFVPSVDGPVTRLLQIPEFSAGRLDLNDPVRISSAKFDSFVCYYCISGQATVQSGDDNCILKQGQVVLVPSECNEFIMTPREAGTVLLEALVDKRPEQDPYINPDAAPTLPGEESLN